MTERRDRVLMALALVAALIYLVPRWTGGEGWWIVVVKGLAISPLAVLAWRRGEGLAGRLLALGLAFSSLGDVLLAIPGRDLFVFGLLAFLVAHLLYIVLFHRLRTQGGRAVGARVAGVVLFAAGATAWLWSDLGALRLPVLVYILAIATMAAVAQKTARPLVAMGAVLFVISDTVLAIGRFQGGFTLSDVLVWSTYVAAQWAILLGALPPGRSLTTSEP